MGDVQSQNAALVAARKAQVRYWENLRWLETELGIDLKPLIPFDLPDTVDLSVWSIDDLLGVVKPVPVRVRSKRSTEVIA